MKPRHKCIDSELHSSKLWLTFSAWTELIFLDVVGRNFLLGFRNKCSACFLPHEYVNVTAYSSPGEERVYAGAMLLLVFNTHVGPQCIVGVGAAERSHLLQDKSNVLSPEKEGRRQENEGKQSERERREVLLIRKLCNSLNRTCNS